ncbi:MAG: Holliday junction branch migration protein RuvA, partial [Phenylobacterium sp.]|nr:Holliday junction branch migration protein RuvA [Phenylobacterium sp.]
AALMGLGVAEMQARRLVEQAAAALGPDAAVSDLVRAGLKEMGR